MLETCKTYPDSAELIEGKSPPIVPTAQPDSASGNVIKDDVLSVNTIVWGIIFS